MESYVKSVKLLNLWFLSILLWAPVFLEKVYVANNRRGSKKAKLQLKACMNLVLYYHDILYNGSNEHNETYAIVATPRGGNLTSLFSSHDQIFGDMVVFNDPLTLDDNIHSPPMGRAQGLYFYDMKNTYSSWFSFMIVINCTDYKGTITLAKTDPTTVEYMDLSVVGGTGDFFMARGITALFTDTFEGESYFQLRLNITLYECY